jgi:hypothetical protein
MLIGGGTRQNYAALLLFLAGGVASGVAVYYTQTGGHWGLPTALALLLLCAGSALVALKKE